MRGFELQTSKIYTRDSISRLSDDKALILSETLIAMSSRAPECAPLLGFFPLCEVYLNLQ